MKFCYCNGLAAAFWIFICVKLAVWTFCDHCCTLLFSIFTSSAKYHTVLKQELIQLFIRLVAPSTHALCSAILPITPSQECSLLSLIHNTRSRFSKHYQENHSTYFS